MPDVFLTPQFYSDDQGRLIPDLSTKLRTPRTSDVTLSAEEIWSMSEISVQIYINAQPIQIPTDALLKQYPNRRWNYVDIPYTFSVPASACFLVTNEVLLKLEEDVNAEISILFMVKDSNDNTIHSFELSNFALDRAVPLMGQSVGDITSEWLGASNIDANESPQEYIRGSALWELYLKDDRSTLAFNPAFKQINIRDPQGSHYWSASLDGNQLYTWLEAVSELLGEASISNFQFINTLPTDTKPSNFFFDRIPTTLAVDIMLNAVGFVMTPDLRFTNTSHRWKFDYWAKTDQSEIAQKKCLDKINTLKRFRLVGNMVRTYAKPNVPAQIKIYARKNLLSGYDVVDPADVEAFTEEKYYERIKTTIYNSPTSKNSSGIVINHSEAKTGTSIALNLPDKVNPNQAFNTLADRLFFSASQVFNGIRGYSLFQGWHDSFFDTGGWSLLTFALQGVRPITSVEMTTESPMSLLRKYHHYQYLKGLPIPVGFVNDGVTTWSVSTEGIVNVSQQPKFFLGKVLSRSQQNDGMGNRDVGDVGIISEVTPYWFDNNTYEASVVKDDSNQNKVIHGVWLGRDTWIEKDDPVLVFYTGCKYPRWMAINIPPVREPHLYPAPQSSCICDSTPPPAGCSSNVSDITVADQDELVDD